MAQSGCIEQTVQGLCGELYNIPHCKRILGNMYLGKITQMLSLLVQMRLICFKGFKSAASQCPCATTKVPVVEYVAEKLCISFIVCMDGILGKPPIAQSSMCIT